jgi:hypothetical protein
VSKDINFSRTASFHSILSTALWLDAVQTALELSAAIFALISF